MHTLSIQFLNKNTSPQSLELNSSCTSLIGKNASGKTTFLKKLALPFSNDIKLKFDDINLSDASILKRARTLSWLSHCERTNFNFKVIDFILLGRYPVHKGFIKKTDIDVADSYLEKLDILELKDRNILSLSKGEYQKINIVRTLISPAPLVILDEPFSNLDISSIVILVNILKSEATDNDRMILSSFHDINIAQAFSTDSFLCINHGKIKFYTSLDTSILKDTYGVDLRYIEGFYSIF